MSIKNLTPKRSSTCKFNDTLDSEKAWISARRKKVRIYEGNPEKDAVGLALSGGGVRSASFNLGLLQALHNYDYLKWIDYLSTVSGGGYIGSSLSWFLNRNNGDFPFDKCEDEKPVQKVSWLRQHASYLTPGEGLDGWALAAAIIRGIFINLLIFIPLILGLVYACTSTFITAWTGIIELPIWPQFDLFPVFFIVGILFLCWLFLCLFLYSILSRKKPLTFDKHKLFSADYGKWLKYGAILTLTSTLPVIDAALSSDLLKKWSTEIISSISLSGLITLITGWIGLKNKDETQGIRAVLLRFGFTLVIFVLLLFAYRISMHLHELQEVPVVLFNVPMYLIIIFFVLFSIFVGLTSDINHVSMHRYYRDRLLQAYMPAFNGNTVTFSEADTFFLKDMDVKKSGAPYHIINTHLNTLGSEKPGLRARGGDNFIFSPYFIGSEATGYIKTSEYINGEMSLATALSISGAAVDPNVGVTRSRPLALVMTLLNVRLGCWLLNPKHSFFNDQPAPPFWHYYALREMMGWDMNEEGLYVHLSDGGHFENLGLYELVRRRCPYIIISDAGADPDWKFHDLALACERVRADFCAETYINTQPLHPDSDSGLSEKAHVTGRIVYDDGFVSKVLYLKTTVKSDLPEDIYGYKRANDKFPDESTSDQFFDEVQFEAYRELGYCIGQEILVNWNQQDPSDIF